MREPEPSGDRDIERLAPFRLGEWCVDPGSGEVEGDGRAFRLEPRMMDVLVYLVRHRDRVVSTEELLRAIWKTVHVTEDVVWRCIGGLRRSFGDDPKRPRFIETLPRRGYRLLAQVRTLEPGAAATEAASPSSVAPTAPRREANARQRSRDIRAAAVACAAALLSGFALVQALSRDTELGGGAIDEPTPSAAELRSGQLRTAGQYLELATRLAARRDPDALDQAIHLYRQALVRDPDFAPAHAGLANAYAFRSLDDPDDAKWSALAETSAHAALAIDRDSGLAHKALALVVHGRGFLRLAADRYRTALRLEPGLESAANNLAGALRGLGELDEALRWQLEVTPATPEEWSIHLGNVAWIRYLLGDTDRAAADIDSMLALRADDPRAHALRARIELTSGDDARSAELLRGWADGDPGGSNLHVLEARMRQMRDDHAGALSVLDSVPEGQRGVEYELRRAFSLSRVGRADEAERVLSPLVRRELSEQELSTDRWAPHVIAAQVAAIRKDPGVALAWLERAVNRGYSDHRDLATEPIFGAVLGGNRRFEELLDQIAARVSRMRARAAAGAVARVELRSPSTGAIESEQ